jgi:virginiamycin B lyase
VRGPLAIVVALAALLCVGEAASANVDVRLPLGSQFNGLAVAPHGQVWVSGEGRRAGRWGRVIRGRVQWQPSVALPGFLGAVAPRSDGGAWLLADRATVLRLDLGGAVGTFGSLAVPFGEDYPSVVTAASGDDLVVAGSRGGVLRIAPDGRAERLGSLPPGPNGRECLYADVAGTPDGAIALADYRCRRLLTVGPTGAVDVVDLRPRRGRRYPGAVLVAHDGTLWFTAVTLRGANVGGVIGHVERDGTIRQFPAVDAAAGPEGFAQAPDGSVWADVSGGCAVYRVHRNRVARIRVPFPVRDIQFAPRGRVWLRGHTRLLRTTVTRLVAGLRARRCETRPPRISFPNADGPTRITLRRLRRSGLRVRSSERATLRGDVLLGDDRVYVNEVIRRAPGVAVLRLPAAVLDRAAAALRSGRTVNLHMNAELRDRSGNGVVYGSAFAVRR